MKTETNKGERQTERERKKRKEFGAKTENTNRNAFKEKTKSA